MEKNSYIVNISTISTQWLDSHPYDLPSFEPRQAGAPPASEMQLEGLDPSERKVRCQCWELTVFSASNHGETWWFIHENHDQNGEDMGI
jgi:hypothetical protein